MESRTKNPAAVARHTWVRDTRFGRWFLGTGIWRRYVLGEAIEEFKRMLGSEQRAVSRILDAGCGIGQSFPLLEQAFQPRSIFGVDVDGEMIERAETFVRQCRCHVALDSVSILDSCLPSASLDMIFCHQLLHHTTDQEGVLRAFYRLLVPGGIALIGESCRPFIRSIPVRLLFRHPMMVQKTASEYVDLVERMGFETGAGEVKTCTPWWSRRDLGLMEKLGIAGSRSLDITEVLIVAKKPAS